MKKLLIWNVLLASCLMLALAGSVWFNARYQGWLADKVTSPIAFQTHWQARVTEYDIEHPAVIHVQPEGCLCQPLSANHLRTISDTAVGNGFSLFQLNSSWRGLGKELQDDGVDLSVAPFVMVTQDTGQLTYIGAYSDGLLCNNSTSLVDAFIELREFQVDRTVVNLDVETCICPNL